MIDVMRTLAPTAGVAAEVRLIPPFSANPLWTMAVELPPVTGQRRLSPMSARMAGAGGHSRADAMTRGAGEAVERFALRPAPLPTVLRGRAGQLPHPAVAVHHSALALAAPEMADAVLDWLPGRRLRDGATVMVPRALVDWPSAAGVDEHFDPGPSCAAAGSSPQMALRSALLEMVERDAVTVAWERGLRLPAYADLAQLAELVPPGPGDAGARAALSRLWECAAGRGITPTLARIPTAVPGLWCVVGCLVDRPGPGALASVGLKVSDRPWAALLGAFQEAWQVRTALEIAAQQRAAGDGPQAGPQTTIVTEDDRIDYLVTAPGSESVRDWVAGFVPSGRPEPASSSQQAGSWQQAGSSQQVSDDDLLAAIVADGGDPVAVDLTPRLPGALREMGWCAVKVVPAGYQNLRMDERHRWSWNRVRLDSAERRTGCEARYPGPSQSRPHPLP